LISGIITQNVDGLHQAGGARDVLELHGALNRVICLDCRATSSRAELDRRLRAVNADSLIPQSESLKPDGDVELTPDQVATFQLVDCLDCEGGRLKPDVVFFGEFLPPERVSQSYELVAASRLLLVLGSSLTVASGFRFVRRAAYDGIDVVIVNQGPTRGDRFARLKIEAPLGDVLAGLNSLI
jgi:NAD-dependent SIR2 family protein deacetylase